MADASKFSVTPDKPEVDGAFDLLGQSWRIFSQKWKSLFWFLLFFPIIIALLFLLLGEIGSYLGVVLVAVGMPMSLKIFLGVVLAAAIVVAFLAVIYFSVVINAAVIHVIDEDIRPMEAFKKARAVFWKFLGWSILFGIAVAIGFIVFVIPGIILLVFWSFSAFVLVLEKTDPIQAFKRSAGLVKGFWWTIFGRFVVLAILVIVVSIISNVITGAGADLFGYTNHGIAISAVAVIVGILLFIIAFAINFVINSISLIFNYLLYKRVKEIKDKNIESRDGLSVGKKVGLGILIALIFIGVVVAVGFMIIFVLMAGM